MATEVDSEATIELRELIATQQEMLSTYEYTIRAHRVYIDTLQGLMHNQKVKLAQQDAINNQLEQQCDHSIKACEGMSAIRDIQEDKLDAKNEEINELKATIRTLQVRLDGESSSKANGLGQTQLKATEQEQTLESLGIKSDEHLYRLLREIGETDAAEKLLASARRLDRLTADDRAWLYQDKEPERQFPTEHDTMKMFVERATNAGVRVGSPK
ncbi:hypothetical protein GGR53DRAFT_469340 [Hypoxylon sp. FL1150]|nr:hypothetical protein GGR53DRAFT_469340 [Hypoxylon sp. FL1150]